MNTEWLDKILQTHNTEKYILAIDGRAASGKSTLAEYFRTNYKAAVIHMDDFFLPMELRTKERLEEPGGNVHYERFQKEVAARLRQPGSFHYQKFNCRRMQLDTWQEVEDAKLVVVEGAYALHPAIHFAYDYRLFVDIDSDTQQARIRKRNGEEKLAQFIARWIPLEEKYFKAYDIMHSCDEVITL